jgi:hypothetical protein
VAQSKHVAARDHVCDLSRHPVLLVDCFAHHITKCRSKEGGNSGIIARALRGSAQLNEVSDIAEIEHRYVSFRIIALPGEEPLD